MPVDGYPTDEELTRIREWKPEPWNDWRPAFEFIRGCWWASAWGWHELPMTNEDGEAIIHYAISTGGWSGNEEIIDAMRDNFLLWSLNWINHRRGGHFVFEVKVP